MGSEARDPDALGSEDFARWWEETGERELRQILFWKWDPLGVWDAFPNTADEYDFYAPQVVQALRDGATAGEIVRLLLTIEEHEMGLRPAVASRKDRDLAEYLVFWFRHSRGRWRDSGPLRR